MMRELRAEKSILQEKSYRLELTLEENGEVDLRVHIG